MNNQNMFFAAIKTAFRLVLGILAGYIGLIFFVWIFFVGILLWHKLVPSKPNKTESVGTTSLIADFYIPKSFELVYSRRIWVSSDNVCLVFNYPGEDYSIYKTQYNYLNQNVNIDSDFLNEFNRWMSKEQGCKKFFEKFKNEEPRLFLEYDYHHEYGRGSKIFVNQEKNLIMFEGYIYD